LVRASLAEAANSVQTRLRPGSSATRVAKPLQLQIALGCRADERMQHNLWRSLSGQQALGWPGHDDRHGAADRETSPGLRHLVNDDPWRPPLRLNFLDSGFETDSRQGIESLR
jgi:hypothetical protein